MNRVWAWWCSRKIRRDIASTAGLILAVAGFFVIIAAVCVAVALLNT